MVEITPRMKLITPEMLQITPQMVQVTPLSDGANLNFQN